MHIYEDIESGFTLNPAHFLAANLKLSLHNTGDADCHETNYGFCLKIS